MRDATTNALISTVFVTVWSSGVNTSPSLEEEYTDLNGHLCFSTNQNTEVQDDGILKVGVGRWITFSKNGYDDYNNFYTPSCNVDNININLTGSTPNANINCGVCSNNVPATLVLSDGLGSVTLTNTSVNRWTGTATRTAAKAYSNPCPPTDVQNSNVSITVGFTLSCQTGGSLQLFLNTLSPCYFGAFPQPGTVIPSSVGAQYATGTHTPTCSPFFISFNDGAPALGNPLRQVYGTSFIFTITQ